MCLGKVRLQFQCPAVAGDRFLQLPLVLQGIAQVVVCLGIVRLQFQCPAVAGDRFLQLPLVLQRIAQVAVRLGIVRLQFQCPAVAGDRFVQLPLVLEGNSQVAVCLGIVRLQFQCPAVAGDRFVKFPLVLQHIAQVVMEGSHIPFQPDRPSNVLDSNVVLAHLVGNHAQQMQRIRMIRLDCENLPIDLLGSLQPTGLMVLDRNRQCFGNRCHDANYGNTTCRPQCVSRERATR